MRAFAGIDTTISRQSSWLIPASLVGFICLTLSLPVLLPRWSGGLLLTGLTLALALGASLRGGITRRLGVFFSLLAVADFLKRLVFLFPDQDSWSQYIPWLTPTFYYIFMILLPLLITRGPLPILRLPLTWPVLGYIIVAMLNTWAAGGVSLAAKMAATVLLILPWTMMLVAAMYSQAIFSVARSLAFWGTLSAIYGLWQFVLGPTPIEINWASGVSGISIGAEHLAVFLRGEQFGAPVWRVIGLQADAFTFGFFLLVSYVSVMLLRSESKINSTQFALAIVIIAAGIVISLVRTIWLSFIVFLLWSRIARTTSRAVHPLVATMVIISAFVAVEFASDQIYELREFSVTVDNPILARSMIFGTVEARQNALDIFISLLPAHWLSGLGYGISPWLTGKFGTEIALPPNFAAHNAVVEILWYTGLPGVLLFLITFYKALAVNWQFYTHGLGTDRGVRMILPALLIAMFVSGLGNGGVFLGYYFFFFTGILSGSRLLSFTSEVRHN